LRRNPITKFLPGMDPSKSLITRMALEELEKRKKSGEKVIDRKDLLSQLMAANEKAPETFKEGDVFAIAHGAMYVLWINDARAHTDLDSALPDQTPPLRQCSLSATTFCASRRFVNDSEMR
jgi:hypothetical protein